MTLNNIRFRKGLRFNLNHHEGSVYCAGPLPPRRVIDVRSLPDNLGDEHLHFGSWNEVGVQLLREAFDDPK